MATSSGKKEYSLKINGVTQEIKNVTTLEKALAKLSDTTVNINTGTAAGATASKKSAAAMTDEEKAAKKLEDTKKRIEAANSEAAKAQALATLQLREATRETARAVAQDQLREGSISAMGMQLTDLRNAYEDLSEAERNEAETGVALLEQIQGLDAEYKRLRESTGNFRDSVGNYEKGLKGLKDLQEGFKAAAETSDGLAANVMGGSDALDAFGDAAGYAAQGVNQVEQVTTVLMQAQKVYIQVVRENIIQEKAAALIDGIRLLQTRARAAAEAAATRSTIGATIAQRAFNIVASANPYVLLALAIIAVGAALFAFATKASNAADEQAKLNGATAIWLDQLDEMAQKTKDASDNYVKAGQNSIKVLEAQGNKLAEIRKIEDDIAKERRTNNARLRGFYYEEVQALDQNKRDLAEYREILRDVNREKLAGEDNVMVKLDLDKAIERADVDEAITSIQGTIDNLERKVKVAVDLQEDAKALEQEVRLRNVTRAKADADAAKDRAAVELSITRRNEDLRLRLIENGYVRARAITKTQYARDIEDIRIRLKNEETLTVKARAGLNATIVSLTKRRDQELAELLKEQLLKEQETARQAEDSRTALLLGQLDRRRAEIDASYQRETQDLQYRLDNDKSLTAQQQADITEIILNARAKRADEVQALEAADLEQRASLELQAVDAQLQRVRDKIGDVVKRDKDGLKLIDVEATRANFQQANAALAEYVEGLQNYQKDAEKAHDEVLLTLQEDTPEYIAEQLKYAAIVDDVTARIKAAQKEQVANTKESTKAQVDYLKELFDEIAKAASNASQAIADVLGTWNMGLQVQVDDMNAQLEVIGEKYAEAQEDREAAVKNVEEIEEQLQSATGGTSEALQEQLADAMAARNEAEREEKRLAKEKEKREAEIAKKEKQIKRNNLIMGIAQAIANTAQGVSKALGDWIFPLNLVVAGIVGAAGLAQVGIMTKQLTKLEDGGEIKGPSHANGGVNIGLGYEAEGGEFMVNKRSYAANADLVQFINSAERSLTASDLVGFTPDQGTVYTQANAQGSEDRFAEALESINFQPVVSVAEIMDVQDDIVTARELSDY